MLLSITLVLPSLSLLSALRRLLSPGLVVEEMEVSALNISALGFR